MRRVGLRVRGTVQGVGFRPFVHRLATDLGLSGHVINDDHGVWCDVQGPHDHVDAFVARLATDAPPLAHITQLDAQDLPPTEAGAAGFSIESSPERPGRRVMSIPPDVAPCAACRRELFDPNNRRFRYPFTCCVDCGPRFTVIDRVPYDRKRTSMTAFPLCPACEREYVDHGDRRFHAQATCCSRCGPHLWLRSPDGEDVVANSNGAEIMTAAAMLRRGGIVALKGVGGYQLLCRADDDSTVQRLRAAKRREEKPFALLVPDLETAEALVHLSDLDRRALTDPAAPILLARRRTGHGVPSISPSVAPHTDLLGVMLPASLPHWMLSLNAAMVLVCTSGNLSDEPIVIDDDDAIVELGHIANVVLGHNRRIARRADDSIGHTINNTFQILRRARGFAPRPIRLPTGLADGPVVLGVGAGLKNTVGLAVGAEAVLSVHLGDLDHPRAIAAFEQTVADMLDLVGQTPDVVAHDLHPEYLSTKFALAADLGPTVAVQHHHAHLASCLVDNGWTSDDGPVLGVTFDGLGWGPDGSLWGGEFLLGTAGGYERVGALRATSMPGGEAAIREPWRMAMSHLRSAGLDIPEVGAVAGCDPATGEASQAPLTSSMGRLFDAVAALCGVPAGRSVAYEGQAAIQLENLAGGAASPTTAAYPVGWAEDDTVGAVIDPRPMLATLVADLVDGVAPAEVAARFHHWVADAIADTAVLVGPERFAAVALTGGVFQNRLLTELTIARLRSAALPVLTHRQVPPNDGGIALGQLAVARARSSISS